MLPHICVIVKKKIGGENKLENWIGEAVAKMHINHISQSDVANKLGIRRDYLNKIFNGKNNPKDAKERIMTAIDAIIAERKNNVSK